ncbi:energy transducer TonB [Bacteroidota bacterium]
MGLLTTIGKPETRFHYKLVFECSFIASLLLIIFVFKFFPNIEKNAIEYDAPQELFTLEDIQQTKQDYTPPPPPDRPSMIIEAISIEDIEDIEFEETELDLSEDLSAPPPPPKEEKKNVIEEEPVFFVAVEEMPQPIGGIKAIHDLIVYPEIAKRAGIEGKVYILAYLNEQGNVLRTEIIKGIGGGCDEAAEFAVKQTKFSPGKQRGKPVKVKVMIPIIFKLSDKPV